MENLNERCDWHARIAMGFANSMKSILDSCDDNGRWPFHGADRDFARYQARVREHADTIIALRSA
jgi:hypothetical protein